MQITKRLTTTVVILSLTAVGLIGVVGIPAALSTDAIIADIRLKQHEIDARFEAQRRIRGSMADFQTVVGRVAELSSVAVRENKELDFVTAIEGAADANDIEHSLTLETANQKDLSPWERQVPFRIFSKGQYPDVVRFLNAIERLPNVLNIDSMNINAIEDLDKNGLVKADFSGSVYWQRESVPDYVLGKTTIVTTP